MKATDTCLTVLVVNASTQVRAEGLVVNRCTKSAASLHGATAQRAVGAKFCKWWTRSPATKALCFRRSVIRPARSGRLWAAGGLTCVSWSVCVQRWAGCVQAKKIPQEAQTPPAESKNP